jgi:hypothetical protein
VGKQDDIPSHVKDYKASIAKAMEAANFRDAEVASRRSEANQRSRAASEDAGVFLINVVQPILDSVAREVKAQAVVYGRHMDCRTGGDELNGGNVFLRIAAHTLMFQNLRQESEPAIHCTETFEDVVFEHGKVQLTEDAIHEVLPAFIERALA